MSGTEGGGGLFARLRKSFGSGEAEARGEAWPLLLHGKLPIYKDFISAGVTEDAAREFRDWLGNGFSHVWSTREEYRESEIPPTRFLVSLPKSRRLVAGTLWGSHDEGGLRRFPFTLFSVVPGGKAAEALVALDALEVFDAKGAAVRRNWDTPGTLSAFYAAHRGSGIEVVVRPTAKIESEVRSAMSALGEESYAASLLGPSAPPGSWSRYLEEVRDAFERARAGRIGAVALTLSDVESPALQAQYWLIQGSAPVPGRGAPTGFLLSQPREGKARVVFFWRHLFPEDVLLLHPGRCEAEDAATPGARLFVEAAPEPAAIPEVPQAPEAPRVADEAAVAVVPVVPAVAVVPAVPAVSEVPAVAAVPAVPDVPALPGVPAAPIVPELPIVPPALAVQAGPAETAAPPATAGPEATEIPAAQGAPEAPGAPAAPDAPVAPEPTASPVAPEGADAPAVSPAAPGEGDAAGSGGAGEAPGLLPAQPPPTP